MAAGLSQQKRIASLQTPLGSDLLGLTRFDGVEGLSQLFEYRIEALSDEENIDFTSAIGANCCVTFESHKGKRFFNGKLVEAQWIGIKHDRYAYRLVLRPWLWLLAHRTNCRIFQNLNVLDVIQKVFKDAGFTDFQIRSKDKTYPVMEYCVQYRETDFAFVSRLMEQYGIYHYFVHAESKHTLVLADSKSSHDPIPNGATIPYIPLSSRDRRITEHIYQWTKERRFRSAKVAVKDYDFMQPDADLTAKAEANEGYNPKLEVYDYAAKYPREKPLEKKKRDDGDHFAKVRLEAEQAFDQRRHCAGDAALLFPGGLFTLKDHPTKDENNKEYLVVRATHAFAVEDYRSGAAQDAEEVYFGNYELLRSDRHFRAPLVTPRPVIHGPQTAQVVGPAGDEIYTDKYGRIKVQFHWDQEGKRDQNSSRWVRVAHVWSGKNWGGQHIPRIGQEAVVEFLEGDPDRPLVVGAVYNEDYKHPYELPDKKTRSGLKSDSSKKGGGYNELYFDDAKGHEEVYFRAEKHHTVLVRDNEKINIGEAFTSDRGDASRNTTLEKGDEHLQIKTGHRKTTIDMGNDELKIKMGNWQVNVDLGCVVIEAMQSITLKVGQSSVVLDQMGVTIKGLMITSEAQAINTVKGLTTTVEGTAMLTLKGGVIMIG